MRYYVLAAKLAGLTLCFALNGCMTAADFPDSEEDRAALEQIRARILEAELKGDASVFEQVAAPDVVVQPPNAKHRHRQGGQRGPDAAVLQPERVAHRVHQRADPGER